MKAVKVSNPIFVKVCVGTNVLLSVGDAAHVCSSFGVDVPMFSASIPRLIKSKFKGSKVSIIDSREFTNLYSRVADSNSGVRLV